MLVITGILAIYVEAYMSFLIVMEGLKTATHAKSNITVMMIIWALFSYHACCRPQTISLVLIHFLLEVFFWECAVLSVALQYCHRLRHQYLTLYGMFYS